MENIKNFIINNSTELKTYIPIVGALLGVLGTLAYQSLFRKADTKKKLLGEVNEIKGLLDSLLRKVEYSLVILEDKNPEGLKKDQAIRNLKDQYFKMKIYFDIIEKISQKEQFFYGKEQHEDLKNINNILWQINLFMYQIDDPRIQEDKYLADYIYYHNIKVYDSIKKSCDDLRLLESKI